MPDSNDEPQGLDAYVASLQNVSGEVEGALSKAEPPGLDSFTNQLLAVEATEQLASHQEDPEAHPLDLNQQYRLNLLAQGGKPAPVRLAEAVGNVAAKPKEFGEAIGQLGKDAYGVVDTFRKEQLENLSDLAGNPLSPSQWIESYDKYRKGQANATGGAIRGAVNFVPGITGLAKLSTITTNPLMLGLYAAAPGPAQKVEAAMNVGQQKIQEGAEKVAGYAETALGADKESPEAKIAETATMFAPIPGLQFSSARPIAKLSSKLGEGLLKADATLTAATAKGLSKAAPLATKAAVAGTAAAISPGGGIINLAEAIGGLIIGGRRGVGATKAVTEFAQRKLDEIANTASAAAKAPEGGTAITEMMKTGKLAIDDTTNRINILKRDLKPEDLNRLEQLNARGDGPAFNSQSKHLSSQARAFREEEEIFQDLLRKQESLRGFRNQHRLYADSIKLGIGTALQATEGAAVGGAFGAGSALPGQEEEGLRSGATIGTLMAAPFAPIAAGKGMKNLRVERSTEKLLTGAQGTLKSHPFFQQGEEALGALSPQGQQYAGKFSGLSAMSSGKPVLVLSPENMVKALRGVEGIDVARAPNGFNGRDVVYANADALSAGNIPHEVIHGTGLDKNPKVVAAAEKMLDSDPQGATDAVNRYRKDLGLTLIPQQPGERGFVLQGKDIPKGEILPTGEVAPKMNRATMVQEVIAALGADIFRDIPPELLFGGRSSGQFISKFFQDRFGKPGTTTQYGFPVTPEMRNALRDALFDLGETAAEPRSKTKMPEIVSPEGVPEVAPSERTTETESLATSMPPVDKNASSEPTGSAKGIPEVAPKDVPGETNRRMMAEAQPFVEALGQNKENARAKIEAAVQDLINEGQPLTPENIVARAARRAVAKAGIPSVEASLAQSIPQVPARPGAQPEAGTIPDLGRTSENQPVARTPASPQEQTNLPSESSLPKSTVLPEIVQQPDARIPEINEAPLPTAKSAIPEITTPTTPERGVEPMVSQSAKVQALTAVKPSGKAEQSTALTEQSPIVAASVRTANGAVFTGVNHADAQSKMVRAGYKVSDLYNWDQLGFIRENGEWVGGAEAEKHALSIPGNAKLALPKGDVKIGFVGAKAESGTSSLRSRSESSGSPKTTAPDYSAIRTQAETAKREELVKSKSKDKESKIVRAGIEAMAKAHAESLRAQGAQFMPQTTTNGEKIEAAVRLRDGTIITAPSHSFAYDKANSEGHSLAGVEEGFKTPSGGFLYRDEALKAMGGSTAEDIKLSRKAKQEKFTLQDKELLDALYSNIKNEPNFMPATQDALRTERKLEDLITHRIDRYGESAIYGKRWDASDPFHSELADIAGLNPEQRAYLETWSERNGQLTGIESYAHAVKEGEATGVTRKAEQALNPAQQRAERVSESENAPINVVPSGIKFNVPSNTFTLTGFNPDKFFNNARQLFSYPESGAKKAYPKGVNDSQLVVDLKAYRENNDNGRTGDGRKQIEGTPFTQIKVNPDYKPQIIPEDRFQVLNAMMGQKAPKGKTVGSKDAQVLGMQNAAFIFPKEGEFNVVRQKLGEEVSLLESVFESIRPENIRGRILDQPVAQEHLLRGGGVSNETLQRLSKTKPPRFAASGFMPAVPEQYRAVAEKEGLRYEGNMEGKLHLFSDTKGPKPTTFSVKAVSTPEQLEAKLKAKREEFGGQFMPGFYSQLQKVIETQPDKASPDQLRAALRNTKQAELKETKDQLGVSFEQWLKENPDAKKTEMLDFVRENQVRVEEVEKGAPEKLGINYQSKYAIPEVVKLANENHGFAEEGLLLTLQNDGDIYRKLTKKFPELAKDEDWGRTVADDVFGTTEQPQAGTKFNQPNLILPGSVPGSYRETLVTLPSKPLDTTGWTAKQGEGDPASGPTWEVRNAQGRWILGTPLENAKTPEEAIKYVANRDTERARLPGFRSTHWDEPNVVLHLRHNMREMPDGKSLFLLEELQSDWAQKGRKEGYASDKPRLKLEQEEDGTWYVLDAYTNDRISDYYARKDLAGAILESKQSFVPSGIPDLPFKSNWKQLGLKIALKKAVESGADSLGWARGETQAARYDLSKYLSKVQAHRLSDSNYEITAFGKNGEVVIQNQATPMSKLADTVGKDLADRIVNQPNASESYSGLDLKVGGEGMKGFYDKELVNLTNDLVKKWNVRVGETKIKSTDMNAPSGEVEVHVTMHDDFKSFSNFEDANTWIRREGLLDGQYEILPGRFARNVELSVHSLPITEAMRRDILGKGFPLFMPSTSPRGVSKAAVRTPDGKIFEGWSHPAAFGEAMDAYPTKQIIAWIKEKGNDDYLESGFVTNSGEWLSRDEAFKRAIELKQITKDKYAEAEKFFGAKGKKLGGGSGLEALSFERAKSQMPEVVAPKERKMPELARP